MAERTSLRLWPTLVIAAALLVPGPEAKAFSQYHSPISARSFCVLSSPPGVALAQARALLNSAIARWMAPTGLDTTGLTLVQDNPCATGAIPTDTVIQSGVMPANTLAVTSTDYATITMSSTVAFWDGIGTRLSTEYGYEGVLAHEMGHVFGFDHEGRSEWGYDGEIPTMLDVVQPADTVYTNSPSQEEWGDVAYARGGARRLWSANPGFESNLTYWGYSAGVTSGSAYAESGSRGARLGSTADYVYTTHTYDPWYVDGAGTQAVDNGMTSSPVLRIASDYKNPVGTTGGVTLMYSYRYLRYDGRFYKGDSSHPSNFTSWSAVTTLRSCATATVWTSCGAGLTVLNDVNNDATAWRIRIQSASSTVYIDKAGAYGGSTP